MSDQEAQVASSLSNANQATPRQATPRQTAPSPSIPSESRTSTPIGNSSDLSAPAHIKHIYAPDPFAYLTSMHVYALAATSLDHSGISDALVGEASHLVTDDKPAWYQDSHEASSHGEDLVEFAGRVCYMAFGKNQNSMSNKRYLENLLAQKHGSVLEHATITFLIAGVSRTLTHELVRHRAGFAFSQLSQRYVDSSDVKFIMPPDIIEHGSEQLKWSWMLSMLQCLDHYDEAVELLTDELQKANPSITRRDLRIGARQASRSVLPNATETKIVVTANLRAWRHFCEMRGSRFAEPEIRNLACALLKALKDQSPNAFRDMTVQEGYVAVEHSKV